MADDTFRILVVCTANICRSVMAERFLRRDVAERGLDGVEITSCGLLFDGEPASDTVIAVLAEREIDASDHRSRKFSPELIADIDLVVTMERMHAREITVAIEGASPRVHLLGGLVSWMGETGELDGPAADRIARFAAGRRSSDLLGSGREEVADPHGRSKRVHRRTADQLEELSRGLLDGLFGPVRGD